MQAIDPNRVAGMKDSGDFSLVLGGPLYQLLRKARLEDDTAGLVRRRIQVLVLLTWLPMLLLAMAEGHAWGETRSLSFLADIEIHARLLLALPLLVLAEIVVHQRMRPVVRQFLDRGLVPDAATPRFEAAIAAALRLRNSIAAELLLIALVFVAGVAFTWRTQSVLEVATWSGVAADGTWRPTLAGWWLGCVSMPIFQFLLLRWYFRLFIWARFQWQVSRIDLAVLPTHPDRCGGLGFIGVVSYAFAPVLLAQGTLLAGMMANRILYAGARLPDFKVELIGLVGVMVFAILGPMLAFAPQLAAAKRTGLREYGTLAQTYARAFDRKWLRGGAPLDEALIGSPDVQSLADMDSSLQVVKEMRIAPFNLRTVFELGVATLLPVGPLLLTMVSLEELLDRLLKVLF
jgi:hypothetical protein